MGYFQVKKAVKISKLVPPPYYLKYLYVKRHLFLFFNVTGFLKIQKRIRCHIFRIFLKNIKYLNDHRDYNEFSNE